MSGSQSWHREGAINLGEFIRELLRRRWWIVASVALFTAVAAMVAFLSTPVYRATTVLMPASAERDSLSSQLNSALGALGGLASIAGVGLSGGDAATEEAIAVLKSRRFTESFISDLGLMPKIYEKQWDPQAQRWKSPDDEAPTLARAFKYFDRSVRSIVRDKKTSLVTLQIEWKDRKEAAAWANELVRRLNVEMQGRAIRNSEASLGFLQKELESSAAVETKAAVSKLIEAQIKQRMLANVTQEYAFRVVDQALPPDADDTVRPRKLLLIVGGALLGGCVAVFVILLAGVGRPEEAP